MLIILWIGHILMFLLISIKLFYFSKIILFFFKICDFQTFLFALLLNCSCLMNLIVLLLLLLQRIIVLLID